MLSFWPSIPRMCREKCPLWPKADRTSGKGGERRLGCACRFVAAARGSGDSLIALHRVGVQTWGMKAQLSRPTVSTLGHSISKAVADAAAHPYSQLALVAFCFLWWSTGLPTDVLTATLSILAITLTQMVLNRQKLRDEDDRRRDVAMHAKLDELLLAEKFARKELAGIEELETEEIAALKLRVAKSRAEGALATRQ
jgi:low affinity Fe/Cu permease